MQIRNAELVWEYMTSWTTEFVIITFGTFIIHEIAFLVLNLFYLGLDEFELCQSYKLHPDRKLKNEIKWNAFRSVLRGHVFQLLPVQAISYPLLKLFGFYSGLPLPTLSKFAFQFIIFNILEDTGFYWVHKWMHTRWAYSKFHYVHHEYTTPFSITGEIAHPVEFLLNFLFPIMVGPLLIGYFQGCHILTFWAWITFREMRSTDAHSGYNLPYHPLRLIGFVYGGPVGHDFHHQTYGRNSQFGGYKFWDWLMGTDKRFHEYQQQKQ